MTAAFQIEFGRVQPHADKNPPWLQPAIATFSRLAYPRLMAASSIDSTSE
jgi:hypothetical protein